ncbi:hypothetical protein WFH35_09290 [Vibrio vulnificus]|uniref:hypothetical protein n=1 Tax=Vibrio vulnificus TaxID=672 RepID=UPI00307F7A63
MKTELEQAKELHDEAVEMLRQSRQMHDLKISNQHSIVHAVSCLLPKHMVTVKADFSDQPENTAQQIADNARCVLEAIEKRDVYDIVHAINALAMENTDVLHVFTYFMAHTNEVTVLVNPSNTVYEEGHKEVRLLNENVYLGKDDTLEKLLSIESQLTELIIEAREAAETKAPEQAVGEA